MVGDHFCVLRLGEPELSASRDELGLDDLTHHMSGGAEPAAPKHELRKVSGIDVEEIPDEIGVPQGPAAPSGRADSRSGGGQPRTSRLKSNE